MIQSPSLMMQHVLANIAEPVFPDRSANILDFGAVPGTDTCQTAAIQAAIDSISIQGGGTVIVPSGRFLTGALHLKSGVNLHLEEETSVLLFTTEMTEEHYPLVLSHWEATPCYNYSALIYACNAHDIGLTGKGVLDAQSSFDTWWGWHHQVESAWSNDGLDLQNEGRAATRRMNQEGVPVSERIFGNGHYLRPNFVQPIHCDRILFQGVTLKNSPMWQLNPVDCTNITVRGMTLSAHGPNSDGCDPESCSHVLIENCTFDTGDDCISLKSGRDRDGRNARPCCNIVIRNNVFADGHGGIALGSEMSGGIHDVYADHNLFESPNLTYVLRFKTNARRGGYIKNIWLHDTVATAVGAAAIHATMLYEDGRNGDFLPRFSDICIEKLKARGGEYGIFLEAFPEVPITGLVLQDIDIEGAQIPIRAMNWKNPQLINVTINGKTYPRPTEARIIGTPTAGSTIEADCLYLGEECRNLTYTWYLAEGDVASIAGTDPSGHQNFAQGFSVLLPEDSAGRKVLLRAQAPDGTFCDSIWYQILSGGSGSSDSGWLISRGILHANMSTVPDRPITRLELSRMLYHLCFHCSNAPTAKNDKEIISTVLSSGRMSLIDGQFQPEELVSREVMATIAMQSCGVSYRNASTTMPVCSDADQIPASLGTNIARALYLGFMECDADKSFRPKDYVTWTEAVKIIKKVAAFSGL